MRTLAISQCGASVRTIIAFVAGVRTLILAHDERAGRSTQSRSLGQHLVTTNQVRCSMPFRKLLTLCVGFCPIHITTDGFFNAHFAGERCLDGEQNQILLGPQIAREFSLERLPNAAC
jgi:hypothetical protein